MDKTKGEGAAYALWRGRAEPSAALSGSSGPFAALTITAHSLVLGLAAVIAGPVPAAQTALSLSRKAVSGAAQEAASVAEAAPESTGTAASRPEAAAPTGGIESYLVELLGDDARPEGAGAVIEKNYPQGSGEKYVACGAGSIKNNTRQTAADIAAEIQAPLPFGVEKDSPDPQVLIMHTHATEDYRLSAGLWYSPGDGARTTDTNLNMCAVGRVMADTLNAAGLNTLHDETLNDYPSYTGSYENSRAVVQRYLAQYPSIKVVLDVHRDAIETEGVFPDGPGLHRGRAAGRAGHDHLRVRQRRQRPAARLAAEPPFRRRMGAEHGGDVPGSPGRCCSATAFIIRTSPPAVCSSR